MRKLLLAATLLSACSTSVPPTNPYDAQNPGARAPVAVTVSVASDDPLAEPGWVSCAPATATPCRVNVTLTSDASPTELQLSADPGFAGASWVAVPPGPQPWSLPFDVPAGADGPVTVHARLRSAAGNVSATFSETIQRKSSAPAAPAVELPSLVADGGAYYTNALLLPLSLSAGGADRMRLSCDATAQPLSGEPWIPFNPGPTCVLVAGNGDRVVSAVFADEAGNVSSVTTTTVRLQQTPPPPPVVTISTGSGTDGGSRTLVTSPTTALTSSTQFVVAVDTSAAGALFSRVDASSSAFYVPVVGPSSVTFTLAQGTAASQATNTLTLRAVDKAGNVSLPAVVTVVQEPQAGPVAPNGLSLFTRPGSIQISWQESPSQYTAGYKLSYGPTASYGGTGADQGTSPIHVGKPCDASGACGWVLTGLSNFQPEYVAVTAVSELRDGGTTAGGSPVTPQPLGLTEVGRLSTGAEAHALAVLDDRAYVVEGDGLRIVDLSAPSPETLGRVTFDLGATIVPGGSSDVVLRWPHAYVAGPNGMYVFDVSDEASPTKVARYSPVDPSLGGDRPVIGLALRWPRAYLHVHAGAPTPAPLLDVVDVTTVAAPARVNAVRASTYGDYGQRGAIAVVGGTVYFGGPGPNNPVRAADVRSVTASVAPTWAGGSLGYPYSTTDLAAELGPRRLVYALETYGGRGTLHLADFTDPAAPSNLGTAAGLPGGTFAVAAGDVYLVADALLEVLDVADPTNPRPAGTYALPATIGAARSIAVSGTNVVVGGTTGLVVLTAAHLQYPQARGQGATLGVLEGGAQVQVRGRLAVVPGNGVSLFDVGDPAAPRVVASTYGSSYGGTDYAPGYGYSGGYALAGDLLLGAAGTQSLSNGSGLVVFDLGAPYGSSTPGVSNAPCGLARTTVSTAASTHYFGVSAHGGYLFATKAGASSTLDVYDLADLVPFTTCSYGAGFAAGPGPRTSFGLAGAPRDVQLHRNWAFVAETNGLEILDVSAPTAPVSVAYQSVGSTVRALSVRLGRCPAAPATRCYHVFLATDLGAAAYTWAEGAASATAQPAFSVRGSAGAVLAAHGLLVEGDLAAGGLAFYDAVAVSSVASRSCSAPQPTGRVYALGAAGRYVYANDGGSFVVQELQ